MVKGSVNGGPPSLGCLYKGSTVLSRRGSSCGGNCKQDFCTIEPGSNCGNEKRKRTRTDWRIVKKPDMKTKHRNANVIFQWCYIAMSFHKTYTSVVIAAMKNGNNKKRLRQIWKRHENKVLNCNRHLPMMLHCIDLPQNIHICNNCGNVKWRQLVQEQTDAYWKKHMKTKYWTATVIFHDVIYCMELPRN